MIIWLASYPKSGNTWMRMFLKNYFMKSNEKFSLEGSLLDSFKPQGFPDQGLLDKLKVDFHKFDQIVKNWETMQDYINLNKRTNFVKTHNAMCTIDSHQFTSTRNTKGAIYIVRDPRDVLISLSHHSGIDHEQAFNNLISSDHCEYPKSGDKRYKKTLMGTWSDHYNSWKNYRSCKILIVKYEDMLLDELNTFTKIINYLQEIDGIKSSEEKLRKAIENSKFEKLQKLEKKYGFSEKGEGKLFFREGKTDVWKKELSESLVKRIEKQFNKEMIELGYLSS